MNTLIVVSVKSTFRQNSSTRWMHWQSGLTQAQRWVKMFITALLLCSLKPNNFNEKSIINTLRLYTVFTQGYKGAQKKKEIGNSLSRGCGQTFKRRRESGVITVWDADNATTSWEANLLQKIYLDADVPVKDRTDSRVAEQSSDSKQIKTKHTHSLLYLNLQQNWEVLLHELPRQVDGKHAHF